MPGVVGSLGVGERMTVSVPVRSATLVVLCTFAGPNLRTNGIEGVNGIGVEGEGGIGQNVNDIEGVNGIGVEGEDGIV